MARMTKVRDTSKNVQRPNIIMKAMTDQVRNNWFKLKEPKKKVGIANENPQ